VVINDPLVIGNVVLCSLVVIRLSFFRKKGATHRTWASWLAYLLILAYATVPLRFMFDHYTSTHWAALAINAIICVAVHRTGGHVAKLLISGLRPRAELS